MRGDAANNGGLTCFADLHLGLDAAATYYTTGYDRHPHFHAPCYAALERDPAEACRGAGPIRDGLERTALAGRAALAVAAATGARAAAVHTVS